MNTVSWQWAKANPDAAALRIRDLERENAALRADAERYHYIRRDTSRRVGILWEFIESVDFFDLDAAIDAARAKQAKACQCTNGVIRSVGYDNAEVINDCPNCSDSKEGQP